MTGYQIYSLILCFMLLLFFVVVFGILLTLVVKGELKAIAFGQKDKEITTEYNKSKKPKNKVWAVVSNVLSILIFVVVLCAFVASMCINSNCTDTKTTTLKVVKSNSMSFKNEKNTYLFENNLDDQFDAFDMVVVEALPSEADLQVYDVVVYELQGQLVVHRIINIEEPNSSHPNERHFLLRGDANSISDIYPVKYSQMLGIYRGVHIPFVGSMVLFLQSPVGYACLFLVIVCMFVGPVVDKKIAKQKTARLVAIGVIDKPQDENAQQDDTQTCDVVATQTCDEQVEQVEIVETEEEQVETNSPAFASFGTSKTFAEKLEGANETLANRYQQIAKMLCRIEKIKANRSKSKESYRKGRKTVAKLAIRGKTLNVYLALDPKEFEDTKYNYQDVSDKKSYATCPMRLKMTSDRQVKWAKELITILAEQNGWKLAEDQVVEIVEEQTETAPQVEQQIEVAQVVEQQTETTEQVEVVEQQAEIEQEQPVEQIAETVKEQTEITEETETAEQVETVETNIPVFASFGTSKTFSEKLEGADQTLANRYQQIAQMLGRIEKIKANRSKSKESYRKGRKTVAKLAIRGKTLNVYLALDPKEFEDTKYNYQDVSDKKSYATCPMRLKMTSDRQVKWAKELITILAEQNGWKLAENQIVEIVEVEQQTEQTVEPQAEAETVEQVEVVEQQAEIEQEQPAEQIDTAEEQQDEVAETVETVEKTEIVEETIAEQIEQPAEVDQVVEEQTETTEQVETVEMIEQATQSQLDEVVAQPKKSTSKKGRSIKRKFD